MTDATDASDAVTDTDSDATEADCVYCGCAVVDHDPVFVAEDTARDPVGWFCNYGCLGAHVEAEGLSIGTTCRVELD